MTGFVSILVFFVELARDLTPLEKKGFKSWGKKVIFKKESRVWLAYFKVIKKKSLHFFIAQVSSSRAVFFFQMKHLRETFLFFYIVLDGIIYTILRFRKFYLKYFSLWIFEFFELVRDYPLKSIRICII